jgi:hypothetical protein
MKKVVIKKEETIDLNDVTENHFVISINKSNKILFLTYKHHIKSEGLLNKYQFVNLKTKKLIYDGYGNITSILRQVIYDGYEVYVFNNYKSAFQFLSYHGNK